MRLKTSFLLSSGLVTMRYNYLTELPQALRTSAASICNQDLQPRLSATPERVVG